MRANTLTSLPAVTTAGVVKAYCDGINTSSIAKGKGEEVPLKTAVTLREPIALSFH